MTNKKELANKLIKKEISTTEKRDFLNEKIELKIKHQDDRTYSVDIKNFDDTKTEQDKKDISTNFLKAFGVNDLNFGNKIMSNITSILANNGKLSETDINFAYSFLRELKPKDSIETMLAVQMLGTHLLSCSSMTNVNCTGSFDVTIENINRATKLSRTYIAQMEALKKYRSKGGQKITVEHINVNDGGKAIIGSTINHIKDDI